MTEREQRAVELLLNEPEIVAWLGAEPAGDDEQLRVAADDDPPATAGSAPRRAAA